MESQDMYADLKNSRYSSYKKPKWNAWLNNKWRQKRYLACDFSFHSTSMAWH